MKERQGVEGRYRKLRTSCSTQVLSIHRSCVPLFCIGFGGFRRTADPSYPGKRVSPILRSLFAHLRLNYYYALLIISPQFLQLTARRETHWKTCAEWYQETPNNTRSSGATQRLSSAPSEDPTRLPIHADTANAARPSHDWIPARRIGALSSATKPVPTSRVQRVQVTLNMTSFHSTASAHREVVSSLINNNMRRWKRPSSVQLLIK